MYLYFFNYFKVSFNNILYKLSCSFVCLKLHFMWCYSFATHCTSGHLSIAFETCNSSISCEIGPTFWFKSEPQLVGNWCVSKRQKTVCVFPFLLFWQRYFCIDYYWCYYRHFDQVPSGYHQVCIILTDVEYLLIIELFYPCECQLLFVPPESVFHYLIQRLNSEPDNWSLLTIISDIKYGILLPYIDRGCSDFTFHSW